MNSPLRRILIINGKGGCGKTTIATNLAVAYACQGKKVALLDNDPQASSTHWASLRDPELPPVGVVAKHERPNMYQTQAFHHRLPEGTEMVIIDGHSNARGRDLESLMRQTDVILVPMLPSSIDIRAGGRFITELLTHRIYRAARKETTQWKQLMHWIDSQQVDQPATAATIRAKMKPRAAARKSTASSAQEA